MSGIAKLITGGGWIVLVAGMLVVWNAAERKEAAAQAIAQAEADSARAWKARHDSVVVQRDRMDAAWQRQFDQERADHERTRTQLASATVAGDQAVETADSLFAVLEADSNLSAVGAGVHFARLRLAFDSLEVSRQACIDTVSSCEAIRATLTERVSVLEQRSVMDQALIDDQATVIANFTPMVSGGGFDLARWLERAGLLAAIVLYLTK